MKTRFLISGKKQMLFQFTKKGEKDLVKNHRPVSLLAIFGKMFERTIFNSLFKYIDENELLNPNSKTVTHQRIYVQYF